MHSVKLMVAVLIIAISAGCTKSADEANIVPVTTGTMTALVNGQAFAASSPISTYDEASKDLTVTGMDNTHLMGFTLENFSAPGTTTLVDFLATGSSGSYTDVKTSTMYTIQGSRTGTVTITKFTGTTIEGTFSMKTYNRGDKREVVLSDGKFKLMVINI